MDASNASVLDYAPATTGQWRFARFFQSPWLLLPLILILAACLRWHRINAQSMWLDEFLAVENSTGRGQAFVKLPVGEILQPPPLTSMSGSPGFWKIWSSLDTETHPPLHFMLLNPWRHAFGEDDLAARSLSAFMSLIAIVLAFDVARLLHGRAIALWMALLMALAGTQIQYAQEARNYTTVLSLMLGAADAIVRIEMFGLNRKRVAALFLCLLAMPLTHYLAGGVVIALFIYAILRLRGQARNVAIATFVAAGLVFLVTWGPFFHEQSRRFGVEHAWQIDRSPRHLVLTFQRLALLPLRYFTEPMKNSLAVGQLGVVIFLIPLVLLPRRRDLLIWVLLMAGAIVPTLISDLMRPGLTLSLIRYTFLASVPVYVLASAMLGHAKGFARHAVPLVLAISCALALEEPYSNVKADSRDLARYLAQHAMPDDLIVFETDPNERWLAPSIYLGISHYATPRAPILFLTAPPDAALSARIKQADQVWLVSPKQAVPHEAIFPGSGVPKQMLFPNIGIVGQIELTPKASAISPTTRPSTQP